MEFYLAVLASLFSVVNPPGAIPVFLALTSDYTAAERRATALRTGLWFALILAAFYFAGTLILKFFGIDLASMRIAGGLVIMISGYGLLYGRQADSRGVDKKVKAEAMRKEDISFSPMAMPMLSGPGSISLLIGYFDAYASLEERLTVLAVIVSLAVICYAILAASPALHRLLGVAGLQALTRIMGFIVLAIGVQYIILGVVDLVGGV